MNDVDPRFWIFLIGFSVFMAVLLYLIGSHSIRRRKGLIALAGESGYDYQAEDRSLLGWLDGFNVVPVGSNRRFTNVVKGDIGSGTFWLFDYSYFTGGSKGGYSSHTVCAIRSSDIDLPYFYFKYRLPGLDRLGSALVQRGVLPERALGGGGGAREIHFAEDDAFSRKFVLIGREPEVRPLFDSDLRQYLMHLAGTMTRIEGHRNVLLVAAAQPILPKNARAFIQESTDLLALLAARAPAH